MRANHALQAMVWYFHGATNSDDDFQRYVDSFSLVHDTPLRPCGLLYVEADNPMPNAAWRKKMAEASKTFVVRPIVVFASPSTVVRAIVTGVNWLRTPEYDFRICGTLEEGLAWLDAKRLGVRALLSEMMDECVAEAGTKRPA